MFTRTKVTVALNIQERLLALWLPPIGYEE